jgi:hypothetical protein
MRKRITPCSRRGSRWMSLARWSNAYCHSQSTTCTTPWSLASSCLLVLPSSTSCSKLAAPALPPAFLRRAHRLGQRKELGRVAVNVLRAGHHAAHTRGATGAPPRPPSRSQRARPWPPPPPWPSPAPAAPCGARHRALMVSATLPTSTLSGSMRRYSSLARPASHWVSISMSSGLPSLARAMDTLARRTSGCWALSACEQRAMVRCASSARSRRRRQPFHQACASPAGHGAAGSGQQGHGRGWGAAASCPPV